MMIKSYYAILTQRNAFKITKTIEQHKVETKNSQDSQESILNSRTEHRSPQDFLLMLSCIFFSCKSRFGFLSCFLQYFDLQEILGKQSQNLKTDYFVEQNVFVGSERVRFELSLVKKKISEHILNGHSKVWECIGDLYWWSCIIKCSYVW